MGVRKSDTPILDFQECCRQHNLRITPQRVAIYEAVSSAPDHPSAEQIHRQVRKSFSNISLNTVNETLQTFLRLDLLRAVEGFGGPRRYDPTLTPHHHLHCSECGRIEDVTDDEFDRIQPPRTVVRGFEIRSTRVVMTGVCPSCRKTIN